MGDTVVQLPRRPVVLLGRPVKPGAAAIARRRGDALDQGLAAALAAQRRIDEQILQIARLGGHPGMRVEQVMDDAGERSRRVVQPRAKASDRTIPRHQPPPSLLIDFGWQRGLVEIEIASPQLVPSRPIGGPQLGYHDLAHREFLTLIVTGTTTWQVLRERNRFIAIALAGRTTFGRHGWSMTI